MQRDALRPRVACWRAGVLTVAAAVVVSCASDGADADVAGTRTDRSTTSTTGPTTTTATTSTPTTSDDAATTDTTTAPATPPATAEPDGPHPLHPTEPPELADSADGVARQVEAAERTVRDDTATAPQVADAAHLLQVAYRHLSHRPEWDATVLASVPEAVRLSVLANVGARREFLGMYTRERDDLPAWRIVPPPPADELLAHYRAAESAYGVPWQYLASIHLVETAMGRVDGVSSAGALGPMQFMPATWDAFGEGDVLDPGDAIMAAARYLAHNGAPDDMDTALFNYNRHRNYVRAVRYYASVMIDDPRTHRGFHHWQVYVHTSAGDVLLPVGYDEPEPVPAAEYLARGG